MTTLRVLAAIPTPPPALTPPHRGGHCLACRPMLAAVGDLDTVSVLLIAALLAVALAVLWWLSQHYSHRG